MQKGMGKADLASLLSQVVGFWIASVLLPEYLFLTWRCIVVSKVYGGQGSYG